MPELLPIDDDALAIPMSSEDESFDTCYNSRWRRVTFETLAAKVCIHQKWLEDLCGQCLDLFVGVMPPTGG